jgi:uncharacterized repeat protein (TIGR03847 family)
VSSYEFPEVDAFTPGTVGPTGQRVFYLQLRRGAEVVTLKAEKQQVAALADYLESVLRDLAPPGAPVPREALQLAEPAIAEWSIGTIGLAYDEEIDRMIVVVEELVEVDPDTDEPVREGGSARVRLTREQVAGFIARARELVAAGRPECPICGQPMDPEGHVCPRSNGHKKPEQ